ncbi:putative SP-containing protein [Vairimorpha necatrix]|uniref:SP-containing protein n=1 Tax=Vairimorpha necatrix TaxID=6039 RepID=A0AAX4JCU8_9MICR
MLICISILSIAASKNNSNFVIQKILDPENIPSYRNKINVYDDDFIVRNLNNPNITKFDAHNLVLFNKIDTSKFNCSDINWQAIFNASDVVFYALIMHKDVSKLIRIGLYMSSANPLYDLRFLFKKLITKFLSKKNISRKLKPIGHLFAYLAYHSYDLVFDLSFYSSFKDLNEIEDLKLVVSKFVDLKIDYDCPWRIIQLYNENMFANPHINSTEYTTAESHVLIQEKAITVNKYTPINTKTVETQDLIQDVDLPALDYSTEESEGDIKKDKATDSTKLETKKIKDVLHSKSTLPKNNEKNEYYLKKFFENNTL